VDILSQIIEVKRVRLEAAKKELPAALLEEQASAVRRNAKQHALIAALNSAPKLNVIAEFKRRSPSKGDIRSNVEPATMARRYEVAGARAVSVLTEEDNFGGSLTDLVAVREAVSCPVLRKDFIFDSYQLYESAAAGADALLLIVAALDDDQLRTLRYITEEDLGMDALVEVHNEEEMDRAISLGSKLIGVNNRDLRTFTVSIETSVRLAAIAPEGTTLVSESGLSNSDDLQRLSTLGYKGFLIGESLMRADDPGLALQALLQRLAHDSDLVATKSGDRYDDPRTDNA